MVSGVYTRHVIHRKSGSPQQSRQRSSTQCAHHYCFRLGNDAFGVPVCCEALEVGPLDDRLHCFRQAVVSQSSMQFVTVHVYRRPNFKYGSTGTGLASVPRLVPCRTLCVLAPPYGSSKKSHCDLLLVPALFFCHYYSRSCHLSCPLHVAFSL